MKQKTDKYWDEQLRKALEDPNFFACSEEFGNYLGKYMKHMNLFIQYLMNPTMEMQKIVDIDRKEIERLRKLC